MDNQIIVITGASSGFGALTARALAKAGHTVYASMRETEGRNAARVAAVAAYAKEHGVDLRTVELDVASDASVEAGIAKVVAEEGHIDVVIHNAGHMSFGPAEAFTPEQFADLYDINVLSTQRVNRALLPYLRKQRRGLVVWVSSSSTRGGTPPYLSPYFAAKAAMDSLAVSYASELARWGIETAIIVPGAFTKGTNHFAHSERRPIRRAPPNMRRGLTPACRKWRCKGWPHLNRPMRMPRASPRRSSRWSAYRSASVRFAPMSTLRRTAPKSSTASPTGCGLKCSAASVLRICCRLASSDETLNWQ